ncbi:unnamed protein product [Lasius platythorax]|uniref:Uncharacterized protein n=1 Tax=Lasius platythorax TaxID=488582 RepID=A0AAV2MYW1_9HYME
MPELRLEPSPDGESPLLLNVKDDVQPPPAAAVRQHDEEQVAADDYVPEEEEVDEEEKEEEEEVDEEEEKEEEEEEVAGSSDGESVITTSDSLDDDDDDDDEYVDEINVFDPVREELDFADGTDIIFKSDVDSFLVASTTLEPFICIDDRHASGIDRALSKRQIVEIL